MDEPVPAPARHRARSPRGNPRDAPGDVEETEAARAAFNKDIDRFLCSPDVRSTIELDAKHDGQRLADSLTSMRCSGLLDAREHAHYALHCGSSDLIGTHDPDVESRLLLVMKCL